MNRMIYSILFIIILAFPIFPQQTTLIFKDDFESYQNGLDCSPIWTISKGLWQIEAGRLVQKTMEYDCGAMLNIFIDYSFELAMDFRIKEGEPGAGFFFHSESYRTTEFSHMSRFESNKTMLIGHFVQSNYECTHSAKLNEQKFENWHRLVLRVDQDLGKYRFYLDDQPIANSELLVFRAGYCGLQSSGGVIEFDNVTLKRLPMKRKQVVLNWLRHFLVTNKNELIIPSKARGVIQRVDMEGNLISSFDSPRNQKGKFENPSSIAQLSNGDFVVGDEGLNCIHLFNKKGKWKNSVGDFGSGSGQLNCPLDICVDASDHIFVVDEGNNRIQVWDANFDFVTEFGKNELVHPAAVAVAGKNIYVLTNGMSQIEIYQWENNRARWLRDFVIGSGQGRDILVHAEQIYVAVGNEVQLFDGNGNLIKNILAESINGIYPFGLGIDKNNQIYIADYRAGRFIIVNKDLDEPKLKITFPSNNQAVIHLVSTTNEKASLRVALKDSFIFRDSDQKSLQHQFIVNNLRPSTTYHFQFSPTLKTIPAADGFSQNYAFITPPEAGKKHYWSLPIATIIFTNVLDSSKMKFSFPALPPLDNEELDRIKSQVEDGIRFYWMNSGMNLFLDNDYIIVDEQLFQHQIFGAQWWYPPKKDWVIKSIENSGKKVEDYIAVLYLACVRDFNEKTDKYEMRGKGSGFTAGIGANSQHGLSYWEVTHANHSSGNNWLMVHEFHHQVDELFLMSGYPQYWFNHFSPTANTAADFGEHFDGNAWILKNWQIANWYDLKFGNIQFTIDEDMDGIPDDDPALPMDEIRLNSSPRAKDSDSDGVSDLNEILVSNWIIEGCGETYGGTAMFPNLINNDTDHDGVADSIDPYPLYPFNPIIKFKQTSSAETLNRPIFAQLLDNRIHATIYAGFDTLNLSFAIKMDRLTPVKLMIDADANGWFLGRDNYLIYLKPKNDLTLEIELVIINCSDPKQWPFHDKELAKKITLATEMKKLDDEYLLTVSIPKDDFTGLKLAPGEKIGVNIGFLVIMDAEGHERYITIFEPNRFFDVELAE